MWYVGLISISLQVIPLHLAYGLLREVDIQIYLIRFECYCFEINRLITLRLVRAWWRCVILAPLPPDAVRVLSGTNHKVLRA